MEPRRRSGGPGTSTAGSVTVEMAIVAPILVLLLFGIIEMGLLLRDHLVLGSACREASRVASLGKTTTAITTRAKNSAVSLDTALLQVAMAYYDTTAGGWMTLSNTTENRNSAPTGSQIRVTLTYPHTYFSPLARMFTHSDSNVRNLHVAMIVIRE